MLVVELGFLHVIRSSGSSGIIRSILLPWLAERHMVASLYNLWTHVIHNHIAGRNA